MTCMELSLASGWAQVEPKETQFELLISGQSPGQQLIAWDTGFSVRREIGYSGGINCPLAVDETGNRVFVSVDGIASYNIRDNVQNESKISDSLSAVWMLEYVPAGPELLMHLHGDDPMQNFIARLNVENGSFGKELLPEGAFVPLDVNRAHDKVLYSKRGGAAVYDVRRAVKEIVSVDLSVQVRGGAFDTDEQRVVFGGDGLLGWNMETGSISRLCEHGSYPAIDATGGVWFSHKDGALAILTSEAGSFDVIVELSGLDAFGGNDGSYAQPVVFSPDGRYGLARLTGRTKLTGKELDEAEAFCKQVGQLFSERHQHRYHHYFCVLDLELHEVWCSEGYAHNVAWIAAEKSARQMLPPESRH